ncbi:MAG: glycoside hydrolase family 99-like domain-containing protein [Lachnospiraceae bacterium]|nr:glycoside hydrolase family 99-like domain-containing protein [Lachnospiraceae bacterium]
MKTKIVSLYLPQFYETTYNNEWWGVGYTDWVATKKSIPLFKNHKQPHAPLNDNYYNLGEECGDTIRWQAKIAREYGVDGFCIYHYWFPSGKYLEKPADILYNNSDIDIDYCFSWDASSWRRTWTASSNETEVLVQQNFGNEDVWTLHYKDLRKFFLDTRYIQIDNKPVFCIYKSEQIECLEEMKKCWDRLAREDGFAGIYLVVGDANNRNRQFFEIVDAFYNYEPQYSFGRQHKSLHNFLHLSIGAIKKKLNKYLGTSFFPDKRSAQYIYRCIEKNDREIEKKVFFGLFANYDDTPRRGIKGVVYTNNKVDMFEKCLEIQLKKSIELDNELLFITAWNEWGESAYLEPDKENGYAYLEAIKRVKSRI